MDYTTHMALAVDILNSTGYLWTQISAQNSAPLINEGDMVCVKKRDDSLKKGDLIAIDFRKMFIIQRIVDIGEDEAWTKGDHSEKGPFCCRLKDVAGKVILVKKKEEILQIDNPLCERLHILITRLSLGRREKVINTGFFYRKFFHKLRRSMIKRLLRLEIILGKRYAKNLDPRLPIP